MKNTIKGNFVGFTNGDPTITNSKVTIKEMTNNKQQTEMNAVEYLDKVNQFAKENNTGKPRQQTAIEWLEQEMLKPNLSMKEILEQAKEMEKQQIENSMSVAFLDGLRSGNENYKSPYEDWEQYYNETYGDVK